MRGKLVARVGEAIQGKIFPGCVLGFVKSGGKQKIFPFGNFTYETDSERVKEDTIYDVASITKSIPTASLALQMIHGGMLELEREVREYLPELRNDRGATIKDLMTYSVQGIKLSTLAHETPENILKACFRHGFDAIGTAKYTNLPAFLLGVIIERVAGDSLDNLARDSFFEPLGMEQTTFFPKSHDNIAPTEIQNGVAIQGIVHDESARAFARAGKAVGHAGLFSTASDLLRFLEALLRGGYPYISAGAERGLGWEVNRPSFMGKNCGEHTFGKTGFTGTSCVCDIGRGIAFVILSNRTYPTRPRDRIAIDTFRADIANVLLRSSF